ncbi:hypothetical protein [Faecalibaculum rodentium]|uniref:hypothetical protein n=1 Tax=Faecalibaculum rodentium TaxID=1702221 RepID=UPI0025842875|nr:hypothetical protein [Faecalibaculum rodentium]
MNKSYKPSINTKFDFGKSSLLNDFIPTASQIDAIGKIFNSLKENSHNHSHMIVGPYGTGKSYLVTLIGGILSKQYSTAQIADFINRISVLSDNAILPTLINSYQESNNSFIPILINGNEGSFEEAILNSLSSIMPEYIDNYLFPGISTTIINTIERWKYSYPLTFKTYLNLLQVRGLEYDTFFESINKNDPTSIELFKEFYKELTSGEELKLSKHNTSIIKILEDTLSVLEAHNLGLLIIYDEFGRYLQSLNQNSLNQSMQSIQDIAELANNGSSNFEFILVSHKSLDSYFLDFSETTRSEFRRIEGRFQNHIIQSDQNMFATLISERIKDLCPERRIPETVADNYIRKMRIYDLYDLGPIALENLIIRGCYPFHPVALYLISVISNIFGQNERTLFTFLESDDNGGFRKFLKSDAKILYPSYLYSYFFDRIEHPLSKKQELIRHNLQVIRNNENIQNKDILLDIYRFISLWELADLQEKQKLDLEFIAFCTGSSDDLTPYLNNLEEQKVIRFNSRLDRYESTEGASVNIDEEVNGLLIDTTVQSRKLEIFLRQALKKRFEKAVTYNEKKSMTRFADISFYIPNSSHDIVNSKTPTSDASIIIYILDNKQVNEEDLIQTIRCVNNPEIISFVSSLNYSELAHLYKQSLALNKLMNSKEFLAKDPRISSELDYLLDHVHYLLEQKLKLINTGTQYEGKWLFGSQQIEINNRYDLQSFLSNLMDKLYPNTPVIVNESLNRNNIPGIQKKAAIQVIDSLLKNEKITGNGPDSTAYYSILTANNYNELFSCDNGALVKLKNDLEHSLETNNSLSEVIKVFTDSKFGYGIRKPIIPILFTALLKPVWNNIMFYSNGSFLMNLSAKNIYEMFQKPGGITYKYHNYSREQQRIIDQIIDLFGTRAEDKDKPLHLKAGWAIYSWLKSMPKYAQITFETSPEIIQLRDAINFFSISPIDSLDQLSNIGIDSIASMRIQIESIVLDKKNSLKNWIFEQFSLNSLFEIRKSLEVSDAKYKKKNPIVKVLLQKDLLDPIEQLSDELIGTAINDWSDNTNEVFKREFLKYFNQWKYRSLSKDVVITFSIDGEEKAINRINDLSQQAKNLSQRLKAMVGAQNQRVSHDEISFILYELLIDSI